MQPLAQRYADRAARKEAAQAAKTPNKTGNDRVGNVLSIVQDGMTAVAEMSEAERAELDYRLKNGQPSEGYKSNLDGLTPFAGIGVPNPTVIPAGAQSGNGSGIAEADISPGDAASASAFAIGQSLPAPSAAASGEEQAAQDAQTAAASAANSAWATPPAENQPDAFENMTVPQLKAELDGRTPPVKYESDANKARLQELARA